jgi:hypothetical protein
VKPLLIRCSGLAKIMTEPKTKAEGLLSVGAKTAIREMAAQAIFGVDFEIRDRKLDKGNLCEPDAIALVNGVKGLMLSKNTERRWNQWLTGECDLIDAAAMRGHDTKCSWSIQTHPLCIEDIESSQRKAYEWQGRGYMMLWPGVDEWEFNHCLVNTPEYLIGYENPKLHNVDHIAHEHRLTSWSVKRDLEAEELIKVKCEAAQAYYAEFVADFGRRRLL